MKKKKSKPPVKFPSQKCCICGDVAQSGRRGIAASIAVKLPDLESDPFIDIPESLEIYSYRRNINYYCGKKGWCKKCPH